MKMKPSSEQRSILLVEPYRFTGHHKNYLLIYSKLFSGLGYKVSVLLREKQDIDTVEEEYRPIIAGVNVFGYTYPAFLKFVVRLNRRFRSPLISSFIYWQSLQHSLRQIPVEDRGLIFILWFDISNAIHPFCFRFIPRNLVVLDGLSVDPVRSSAFGMYAQLTLANRLYETDVLRGVLFLSEEAQQYFQRERSGKNLFWVPELVLLPAITHANTECIRTVKEFVGENAVVLYVGGISEKKKNVLGMLKLAEAMQGEAVRFVVVGKLHEDHFTGTELNTYRELKGKLPNLLIIEQRSSDSELIELINLSDWIYLVYKDHPHSSNFLTQAIQFRKAVIVSAGTLMHRRVKKYRVGYTYDEVISDPGIITRERIGDDSFNAFSRDHSPDFAAEQLKKMLA